MRHVPGAAQLSKKAQTQTQTPTATGLALDAKGFVAVEPTFQSTSHPGVFAAGDICAVLRYPRPKV